MLVNVSFCCDELMDIMIKLRNAQQKGENDANMRL